MEIHHNNNRDVVKGEASTSCDWLVEIEILVSFGRALTFFSFYFHTVGSFSSSSLDSQLLGQLSLASLPAEEPSEQLGLVISRVCALIWIEYQPNKLLF